MKDLVHALAPRYGQWLLTVEEGTLGYPARVVDVLPTYEDADFPQRMAGVVAQVTSHVGDGPVTCVLASYPPTMMYAPHLPGVVLAHYGCEDVTTFTPADTDAQPAPVMVAGVLPTVRDYVADWVVGYANLDCLLVNASSYCILDGHTAELGTPPV